MYTESINDKIQYRYSKESQSCNSLSCGDNFSFLDIQKGEIILDLGCGRGKDTIRAAQLAGENGFAIGLDITIEMVEKAIQNAKHEKVENVDFVSGNIEELPLKDNFFNKVISNCVINHAKNKRKVYEEIWRVLKKDGSFVISDAVTKFPLPLSVKNDPEAWALCYGGAVTEEDYIGSIKSAGFDNIEIVKRREYLKNEFEFISLTIRGYK